MDPKIEQIQILYEISMSIGSSLKLNKMIKATLFSYLKKLNCLGGSIIKTDFFDNDLISDIYSIPKNINKSTSYKEAIKSITDSINNTDDFSIEILPIVEKSTADIYYYVMNLNEFGLLILFKSRDQLDPLLLKLLEPVNQKFASACIACVQEEVLDISEKRFRSISSSAQDAIIMIDYEENITFWNESAVRILGHTISEALGNNVYNLISPPDLEKIHRKTFRHFQKTGEGIVSSNTIELIAMSKDRNTIPVELSVSRIEIDKQWHLVGIMRDITERKNTERDLKFAKDNLEEKVLERTVELSFANNELEDEIETRKKTEKNLINTQAQLIQSEKLAGIGQLAAGIAHEINTPIQYIGSNIEFLLEAFKDLESILDKLEELKLVSDKKKVETIISKIKEEIENADISYLKTEIPESLNQSNEGVAHISKTIRAMKHFVHPGQNDKKYFNIKSLINNAINLSRNEWKYSADMELKSKGDIPEIFCLGHEMGQVFLNLIINAAHSIKEKNKEEGNKKGKIIITIINKKKIIEIRVRDTGNGIPEKNRNRIFEPFFTTKPPGSGTGQGLSMVYTIIVVEHKGSIKFETELGKGTTFIISLPKIKEGLG